MKTTILNKLKETEAMHGIKLLYACESGSRAWGFPSPDSDYDVRFIYLRSVNYYLSVQNKDDQLNFPINDVLDINGWDLQKTLHLITRSNTTPFEWLQSSVVYREEEGFRESLFSLCLNYFCARSNIFHYLGICRSALGSMGDSNDIKIKKLFYVIRPLLAALWCADKNTIAPISIFPLMELLPFDLQKHLTELIKVKSTAKEAYLIKPDAQLLQWINDTYDYCNDKAETAEKQVFDLKLADDFFIKILEK